MAQRIPKLAKRIIIIGIVIVIIAIASVPIGNTFRENQLAGTFATAEGSLVVESSDANNNAVVSYLESERSGDYCAAKTVGRDDKWIYAIAHCMQTYKDQGYTSAYELRGRFGYTQSDATVSISSSQFVGDGGVLPSIQELVPYKVYQAMQKEIDNDISKTLSAAAQSREASLKQ